MEIQFGKGYKAVLKKDYLTYRESIEIQKLLFKGTKGLKPTPDGNIDFELVEPSVIFEINLKTFEFLIDKIITPDGQERKDIRNFVLDLPQEVVEDLTNKINEITKKK